ncbi:MAG: 30S ribosomal protein S17 [Deltaproteobacteria bacterium CG11_big_fil_rev_8_21_14_0_20_49_13]|nr:MAG: 30S ribosomal protein S17 [Deltaproteobacteria bacterium CG11_big_fil_rev_8_21_14_0_20_49_13]
MQRQIKNKTGVVIRRSGDKSVIVEVERLVIHPTYKKYIRKRKKFHVHDDKNICQLGDKVRIIETRPISKTKCWKLSSVLAKGDYVEKGIDDTAVEKSV